MTTMRAPDANDSATMCRDAITEAIGVSAFGVIRQAMVETTT